jgi:hypothetical protein
VSWPEEHKPDVPAVPLPKRRRWGLRTLGCVVLVMVAVTVANAQGHHTPGTLGCVVLGLAGAIICSVQGIRDLLNLEWYKRRLVENARERD